MIIILPHHSNTLANKHNQVLETFQFRTGFAPNEPVATHSRKRYRLVPSRHIQPDVLHPDPSLFIVHYSSCEPTDRVPANIIPLNMQIQQTMQTRAFLQSQGQIVKRDFMLHDRANWPQITMPSGANRGVPPGRQPAYSGPARMSQSIAYPPQAQPYQAHQPNKRPRPNPPGSSGAPSTAPLLENGIEEEEDTVRGDLFDQVTPREIAYCRYKQNHEWMEEIFSSPYHTNQIEPVDLGLGKPGTLGKLTEGIYEIPNYQPRKKSSSPEPTEKKSSGLIDPKDVYYNPPRLLAKSSYVAKLDPEKAEEFRKRTSEHMEKTNAEIEKMKAKHAKKMAKFKAGGVVSAGEKKLRKAVTDPEDVGPEIWRLEGRLDPDEDSMGPEYNQEPAEKEPKSKVEDIVAQVQASLGRTAAVVLEVKRIQDGGLEERQVKPVASVPQPVNPANGPPYLRDSRNGSQQSGSGVMVGDTDMGMDDTMEGQAAGLLDQFHTGDVGSASAFSNHSTPAQNFSTPQAMLHQHSAAGTPSALGNMNAHSPQQGSLHSQGMTPQQIMSRQHSFGADGSLDLDVEMGDATDQTHGGSGNGTDDWIVVPPGGVSPQNANQNENNTTATSRAQATSTHSAQATGTSTTPAQSSINQNASPDISGGIDTSSFEFSTGVDDASGFHIGDDEGHGDGGDLDLSMDLGMDDSAFGDAFHGVEGVRNAEDGDGDVGGMGGL